MKISAWALAAMVCIAGCSQGGEAPPTVVSTPPPAIDVTHWQYHAITGEMDDAVSPTAIISSKNTVEFKFPYAGEQRARIMIAYKADKGYAMLFAVDRGQILCAPAGPCPITLRIDGGKQFAVEAERPNDQSSNDVVIRNSDDLASKIFAASNIKVQATFFQNGSPVFDFDVSGFDQYKFARGG